MEAKVKTTGKVVGFVDIGTNAVRLRSCSDKP
jgi:exopolyphosphatase/pppGpp-phosphohydrolase